MREKGEIEKFQVLLEKKGLKYTRERQHIYEEVSHLKQHFDADSLYGRFKRRRLRVSRDTVYRTIPLLLESGVIQKSVGEGKREFFERTSARGHHDHILCVRCQRIIEFKCQEIENLQEKICGEHGFKLIFHDHRLLGYCRDCQSKMITVEKGHGHIKQHPEA